MSSHPTPTSPMITLTPRGTCVTLPPLTRIVLLRHAESIANAMGILQGQSEYPLSTKGRAQATSAALVIHSWRPVRVISSPSSRAIDTATLATGLARPIITIDDRLHERFAGRYEGLLRRDLEHEFPGMHDHRVYPIGFEPISELIQRTLSAVISLNTTSPSGTLVAFTHSSLLRNLTLYLGGELSQVPFLSGIALGPELNLIAQVDTLTAPHYTILAPASDC